MRPIALTIAAAASLAPLPGVAGGLPISWSDLRPAAQHPYAMVIPGQPPVVDEAAAQLSQHLSGQGVEVTGYLLPYDREGDRVYGFLLLPWTGACSHTPPPPPNQIVVVHSATPFQADGIYQPVTVSGMLEATLEQTQVLMLDGTRVVQSDYRIAKAEVRAAEAVRDGLSVRTDTPWPFLRK